MPSSLPVTHTAMPTPCLNFGIAIPTCFYRNVSSQEESLKTRRLGSHGSSAWLLHLHMHTWSVLSKMANLCCLSLSKRSLVSLCWDSSRRTCKPDSSGCRSDCSARLPYVAATWSVPRHGVMPPGKGSPSDGRCRRCGQWVPQF